MQKKSTLHRFDVYTKTFPFAAPKSWTSQVLKCSFSTCHQETESLRSQLDRCQLVCRMHSWLGGQVAATPELSIEPPPAASLHELWCEFGDTVNGAKTKDEAAAKEARREAARIESKAREEVALRLPPFPRQITVLTLNFVPSCVSPDASSVLSRTKKPGCASHRDREKDAAT